MQADEFERCWHENVRRVTAYVERHVGREASYDVVSSTFLVAWRHSGVSGADVDVCGSDGPGS